MFGKVSDFPEFYSAARLVLSGQGDQVYVLKEFAAVEQALFPQLGGRIVGFFVPPFAMPWIVPIGWIPLPAAIAVWKALLITNLVASIVLLSRAFELKRQAVLWLIAVCFLSGAVYDALKIDQLATFLLLALSTFVFAIKKDRPILAGASLSILLLKPQEALPIFVYLLAAKKYRIVFSAIGIGLCVALIAFFEIGISGFHNYSALMASTVEDTRFLVSDLSPSLRGQLLRLMPAQKGLANISASIYLIISLAAIFYTGRKTGAWKEWWQAGLVAVVPLGLVSCLYFFDYDFVLLLPTMIVLLQEKMQERIPPVFLLSGMLLGLAFLVPFSIFIHYNYLLPGGLINPFFVIMFIFAPLAMLFVHRNQDLFD